MDNNIPPGHPLGAILDQALLDSNDVVLCQLQQSQ
jgi:hypothetical protein